MANPRNIDDRTEFFERAAKQRSQKRPRKTGWSPSWADRERTRRRDVGEAIYEAAQNEVEAIISYTKITEDYATRIWTVEPYSYRYRWLTGGGRWDPAILKKVFFGYDVVEDTTKMFMYGNIHDVLVTTTGFSPRWEIEVTMESSIYGPIGPGGPSSPER
jgi:hypothetical protein